jgi:uncharacterized protein (DUF1778 family)
MGGRERRQIRVNPSGKAPVVVTASAAPSIRLPSAAAVAFSEALEKPAEVNHRLARALSHKRAFSWLD